MSKALWCLRHALACVADSYVGACEARGGEGSPPGRGRAPSRSRFQAMRDGAAALEDQENIAGATGAAAAAAAHARKQVGCSHRHFPQHALFWVFYKSQGFLKIYDQGFLDVCECVCCAFRVFF